MKHLDTQNVRITVITVIICLIGGYDTITDVLFIKTYGTVCNSRYHNSYGWQCSLRKQSCFGDSQFAPKFNYTSGLVSCVAMPTRHFDSPLTRNPSDCRYDRFTCPHYADINTGTCIPQIPGYCSSTVIMFSTLLLAFVIIKELIKFIMLLSTFCVKHTCKEKYFCHAMASPLFIIAFAVSGKHRTLAKLVHDKPDARLGSMLVDTVSDISGAILPMMLIANGSGSTLATFSAVGSLLMITFNIIRISLQLRRLAIAEATRHRENPTGAVRTKKQRIIELESRVEKLIADVNMLIMQAGTCQITKRSSVGGAIQMVPLIPIEAKKCNTASTAMV